MSYLKALTKAAATENHNPAPGTERQRDWSNVREAFRDLVSAKNANQIAEASFRYLNALEAYEDRWT